uniref:DUF4537 domain-containing protein n=2 Tax=Molossus molossus TaxID=27622 RepID=A0A7J8ENY4_MOLMO|nr:hypothetical protein HJG59_001658 [Molossus molossus]
MESSAEPGTPLPKYCSVATILEAPAWASTAPPWDLSFTCPFALQAPWLTWHNPLPRCVCYQQCIHIGDPPQQGSGCLGGTRDAADTWVLARREPDGFYYRAQIKTAPELERQGALLVEFEAPLVTGPELPVPQHSVVLGDDVIPFSPPMKYSPQPGDKVLAPWEPDRQRYGPATVLGLETTDPQRASLWCCGVSLTHTSTHDLSPPSRVVQRPGLSPSTGLTSQHAPSKEEITVHFWNGRTAAVPLGGVRRVPPAVWRRAVEGLHRPFSRGPPSALLWAPCCSLLGPGTGWVTDRLPLGTPFLCPLCHPHACCQLLCQGCPSCCPLVGTTWWPLTRTSGVNTREYPVAELKPTAQLLPLEAPKEEELAVQMPITVASSEEDLEKGLGAGLPQRLVVDSTVNADPGPRERTLRRRGGLCRPEWRYWRRSGPEPPPPLGDARYTFL